MIFCRILALAFYGRDVDVAILLMPVLFLAHQVLVVIMMAGSILMTIFTMYTVYQRWRSANSMRMLVLDEQAARDNPRVVPVTVSQ